MAIQVKKISIYTIACSSLFMLVTGCSKKYTCAVNGMATEIYYAKDYSQAQLTQFDTLCVRNGGVWSLYNQ